jgi:hypothetical protein
VMAGRPIESAHVKSGEARRGNAALLCVVAFLLLRTSESVVVLLACSVEC